MSFFNTIGLSGSDLKKAEHKTSEQEEYVLRIMYKCDPDNKGMTSDEIYRIVRERKQRTFQSELQKMYESQTDFAFVWTFIEAHYVKLSHALISIRRSMTDLVSANVLVKTDEKRKGSSGLGNHIYKRTKS